MDDKQKPGNRPPGGDSPREITYRVGWSRGTIKPVSGSSGSKPSNAGESETSERTDAGEVSASTAPRTPPAGQRADPVVHTAAIRQKPFTYRGIERDRDSIAERIIWRPMTKERTGTHRLITVLLWAAPIISFALTYALVLALTRIP
ncbi:hypothetical protein ACFFK0_01505 [Paenibacillus chartarius]|uniref:DUF5808 domain-containing protein n=1 Tax=Paenibacillus chartarius TaxID=747481 RepID=A0ABV6DER4_9BACL